MFIARDSLRTVFSRLELASFAELHLTQKLTDGGVGLVSAEDVSGSVPPLTVDTLSPEQEKALDETKESFVFQAEVNRLMDIIINSLCKRKPIYKSSYNFSIYCIFRQEQRSIFA